MHIDIETINSLAKLIGSIGIIDVAHAGTLEDPIPASRGMEYEYGKYYLDGEDDKTYKCERIGEAAGGTIVLQYMPHELIGNYFTAVNV